MCCIFYQNDILMSDNPNVLLFCVYRAQAYPNIKLMIVGVHGIGKTSLLASLRKEGSGGYQQSDHKSTFSERRVNEKGVLFLCVIDTSCLVYI